MSRSCRIGPAALDYMSDPWHRPRRTNADIGLLEHWSPNAPCLCSVTIRTEGLQRAASADAPACGGRPVHEDVPGLQRPRAIIGRPPPTSNTIILTIILLCSLTDVVAGFTSTCEVATIAGVHTLVPLVSTRLSAFRTILQEEIF